MIEHTCVSCAFREGSNCWLHAVWSIRDEDKKFPFHIGSIKSLSCAGWEIRPGFMGTAEEELQMLDELFGGIEDGEE